jgi:hypothetical protein
VLRAGEEGSLVGELDDIAEIHHSDAVADVLDDREIVGDEEVGSPNWCCRSPKRLITWACTETSRAGTGSSQMIKIGSAPARGLVVPS